MKNLFISLLFALPLSSFGQKDFLPPHNTTPVANSVQFVSGEYGSSMGSQFTRSASGLKDRLQLNSFVAKTHHVSVVLSWALDRPVSKASFIVERALDNADWKKVGVVNAAEGQQEFSFWDARVEPGADYYYRLINKVNGENIRASAPIKLKVDNSFDEYLIILSLIGFIGYIAYQARNLVH